MAGELNSALERVKNKEPELYSALWKVNFLVCGKAEAACGLLFDLGEEIDRLRHDVLGDETKFFAMEED